MQFLSLKTELTFVSMCKIHLTKNNFENNRPNVLHNAILLFSTQTEIIWGKILSTKKSQVYNM